MAEKDYTGCQGVSVGHDGLLYLGQGNVLKEALMMVGCGPF